MERKRANEATARLYDSTMGVSDGGGIAATWPANQVAFRELVFVAKFPQQCRNKLAARSQLLPEASSMCRPLFRESCPNSCSPNYTPPVNANPDPFRLNGQGQAAWVAYDGRCFAFVSLLTSSSAIFGSLHLPINKTIAAELTYFTLWVNNTYRRSLEH